MSDYRSDIVIVTALDVEFRELQRALGEQRLKRSDADHTVYSGTLQRGPKAFLVYAAHQPWYGMTSAAILATRLIKRYRPRYVVMLGIAAGFEGDNAKCGDIIIANYAVNYQEGKVSEDGFRKDGIGLPLDPDLHLKFQDSMDDILDVINDRPGTSFDAYIGPILTGSQVVDNPEIMTYLKDHVSRKAVGLDMEGVAIFQAAQQACGQRKPSAIVIKGVSDLGHHKPDAVLESTTGNREIAAFNSARYFLEFLFRELDPDSGILPPKRANVEIVPRDKLGPDRGMERLVAALGRCGPNSQIKLISITGRSLLAPDKGGFIGGCSPQTETQALRKALEEGAHCQVILLAPRSKEAEIRIRFESPRMDPDESMLRTHSGEVERRLPDQEWWGKYLGEQLEVKYSEAGLGFGLWMFAREARLEPYHFGKSPEKRGFRESPLCSFCHLWISEDASEFELLKDHFENLWSSPYTLQVAKAKI